MHPIINKLICAGLSVIIIILMSLFIKTVKESNQMKNGFIRYLEDKKDYQNLIKFGFYNVNGFKENRRVPFLGKIIFEEYQKNKDKTFLDYYVYIKKSSKKLLLLFFLSFVLFCCNPLILKPEGVE